jgi:hypothetical protein
MELLKSIVVDSNPSLTVLLKFGFVEALKAVKSVLLFYPLNVLLLVVVVFAIVHRATSVFKGKTQFKAVYSPLPHHDSPV